MFHSQKLKIAVVLAAGGAARAQISVSVDRLDGNDPGAPAPASLVIVDVFVGPGGLL